MSTGTFSPKDIKECHLIISFRAFVPRAFPIAQSLLLSMMHPCMGPMLPFSTQFPAWTIGNRNQVAGSPWAEVYVSKAPARSSSKPCAPWHCAHGNETAKFQEARESDLVLCINPHTHSAVPWQLVLLLFETGRAGPCFYVRQKTTLAMTFRHPIEQAHPRLGCLPHPILPVLSTRGGGNRCTGLRIGPAGQRVRYVLSGVKPPRRPVRTSEP